MKRNLDQYEMGYNKQICKLQCINPKCCNQENRNCQIQHGSQGCYFNILHCKCGKCKKWIIDHTTSNVIKKSYRSPEELESEQLDSQLQPQLEPQQIQSFKLQFNCSILSQIQKIRKNKIQKIKKLLSIRFQSIRQYFNKKINQLQERVLQKLNFIIQVKNIFVEIDHLVKNDLIQQKSKIHGFNNVFKKANQNIIENIVEIDEFQIFDSQSITSKIKALQDLFEIQNLGLYSQIASIPINTQELSNKKMQQKTTISLNIKELSNKKRQLLRISNVFKNYIYQQCENPLGKIQNLATQLGRKAPCFETNVQNSKLSLKCYLCQQQFIESFIPSNKKLIKKQIVNHMFEHLISEKHIILNGLTYQRLIKKTQVNQVKYHQVMPQISKAKGQIHILDRQSGIIYAENSIDVFQGKTFILELISQKNAKIVKEKFIKVEKREHLDIMATILALQLSRSGKKVKFYSNSPYIKYLQSFFSQYIDQFAGQCQTENQQQQKKVETLGQKYSEIKHKLQYERSYSDQQEFSRKAPHKKIKIQY